MLFPHDGTTLYVFYRTVGNDVSPAYWSQVMIGHREIQYLVDQLDLQHTGLHPIDQLAGRFEDMAVVAKALKNLSERIREIGLRVHE